MTPTDIAAPPAAEPAAPPPTHPDLLAEPTFEECIEEGNRYFDDLKAGRLDFTGIPDGHYVAYYGGQLHGHGPDMVALGDRVAAALGVHWARLSIHYCGDW